MKIAKIISIVGVFMASFTLSCHSSDKKTTEENLQKIRNWQKSYFKQSIIDSTNLFYPFSGPDFLYAQATL